MTRLDQRLVALGLAASRARARALLEAGVVRVNGAVEAKAARSVAPDDEVAVLGDPCPWVSRAALKLLHGLETFGLSLEGAQVLDLGASTGGFSEVCLARGATRVWAVDVGHGQLAPALRADPRVVAIEGKNARALAFDDLGAAPDFVTADLSFIALEKALGPALRLARPGARLVALVKPQFEVGRALVGKGGVVKDREARRAAVAAVAASLGRAGWRALGDVESPIAGGDGNIEHLLAAEKRAENRDETPA